MKWYSKKAYKSQWGDERTRKKFIWFPTTIGSRTYWLTRLTIVEVVIQVNHLGDFDELLWTTHEWRINSIIVKK